MTTQMKVAGTVISAPFTEFAEYGRRHYRTVADYDLGGVGDPVVLSIDEVARTRVIASRVSNAQSD